MEARSTPALPMPLIPPKNNVLIFFDMTAFSWKSPEPTAVGAVSSAVAVHVTSRRWLSFLRYEGVGHEYLHQTKFTFARTKARKRTALTGLILSLTAPCC